MTTLISLFLLFFSTILFSICYFISVQPATLALRIGNGAYKICEKIRIWAMIFQIIIVFSYILFILGDTFNFTISSSQIWLIRIIGIIITTGSLGFMTYSARIAGRETTAPSRETKLYGGIYNFMRHPQTLGEMFSFLGISLILNSLTLSLYSLIWFPLFISFTVIEDNDLALRFGENYIQYTKKVGIFWKK